MKTIGIVGGMGPETTAKIYLEISTSNPKQIPKLIIINVAFPKILEKRIINGIAKKEEFLPYLIEAIKELENAGADFIAIPCNSVHKVLKELNKSTHLKIIDLIGEVSKIINKYKRIGIIATTTVVKNRLYNKRLRKSVKIFYPSKKCQEKISNIILKIVNKKSTRNDIEFLDNFIHEFKIKNNLDKIVLACTDLANVLKRNDYVIDSQRIFVDSILKRIN